MNYSNFCFKNKNKTINKKLSCKYVFTQTNQNWDRIQNKQYLQRSVSNLVSCLTCQILGKSSHDNNVDTVGPILGQADTGSGNGPAIYHSVDTVGPILGQADTGSGNGPEIYQSVDTVGPILGQADTGSGNGPAIYHNADTESPILCYIGHTR